MSGPGWRAEAQFRADARVRGAIDVLAGMTAAGLREHLALGDHKVRALSPEKRAQWEAQMDALDPVVDAWIEDECEVWYAIVLAMLEQRDLLADALARGDRNWPTSADAVIDEARKRLAGGGA